MSNRRGSNFHLSDGPHCECRLHPVLGMARPNAPFYRQQRDKWYARVGGRILCLNVRGRSRRKEAMVAFARLLVNQPPPAAPDAVTVAQIVTAFLSDCKPRVSPACHRNYSLYLRPFARAMRSVAAVHLAPDRIEAYARAKPWSPTYRANFLATVTTCYRAAVRLRLLTVNPLPPLHRPPRESRGAEATITQDEYEKLRSVADPLFRDYLTLLWGTGARPGEIAALTVEMVLANKGGIVPLRKHKGSHAGRHRCLILTGEALTVATARAQRLGSGLLFRGRNGVLSAKAIGSRMEYWSRKAGIRRVIAYGFRHSFATDALCQGIPDATVAALLGHSGTGMLHQHYSHLVSRTRTLVAAAESVRKKKPPLPTGE